MSREIEEVVRDAFPHMTGNCMEGRCICGANKKRARMLAAIQMHVDRKTGGRVYLDRA